MARMGRQAWGVVGSVGVLMVLGVLAVVVAHWEGDPNAGKKPVPFLDTMQVTIDIEYARVGGVPLGLDVYQMLNPSPGDKPRPALLMIHGGGWVEGDKIGEGELAQHLVPQGFVVFAVNYRLSTESSNPFPAAILDVRRAARWVRAHAAEYGADPKRLGAVGMSAGGHLAALLGTTEEQDRADPNSGTFPSRADCVVDTCGPTDFTDENNPAVGPKIAQVIPVFLGGTPRAVADRARAASPLLQVDRKAAPTIIFHGSDDDIVPIEQSRRFAEALTRAGVENKLVVLDGEGHGFHQPANQQRWVAEMSRFLNDHLKP